jgi:hypothetical protein
VSAYDYYNFVMNLDGRLRTWGDREFAHTLVEFAEIEVRPVPQARGGLRAEAVRLLGYRGSAGLLAGRDRQGHRAAGPKGRPVE